jgi:hypothetical protein
MGNSCWRLQTALNYVAQQVHELARETDVEILVTDWGSDIPLREVLELSSDAARMVSFIQILPNMALDLQKDSPFSEVVALNAAARRADGEYIGRIDQDTLVGKRFLENFFELYEGKQKMDIPMQSALFFSNQRMVPYRFCVRYPSFWAVQQYIKIFGRFLKIELIYGGKFYYHGVGIWLIHRDLWNICGGYDERMIYMNNMEINMIERLKINNRILVDLGALVNHDFYHMEHYHPLVFRSSSTHRKVNPLTPFLKPDSLHPNGPDWGLIQFPLEKMPYSPAKDRVETVSKVNSIFKWLSFIQLIILSGAQVALDEMVKAFRIGLRRVHIAWETVHHQPFLSWPRLLSDRWQKNRSVSVDSKRKDSFFG